MVFANSFERKSRAKIRRGTKRRPPVSKVDTFETNWPGLCRKPQNAGTFWS